MHKAVIIASLLLASCGTDTKLEVPSDKVVAASELPSAAYTEKLVYCDDPERIAQSLALKFQSTMDAASKPRFTQFGHTNFADGELYAIMIEFEPGDPGVTSSNVDYAAVRADCTWAYLSTEYDR